MSGERHKSRGLYHNQYPELRLRMQDPYADREGQDYSRTYRRDGFRDADERERYCRTRQYRDNGYGEEWCWEHYYRGHDDRHTSTNFPRSADHRTYHREITDYNRNHRRWENDEDCDFRNSDHYEPSRDERCDSEYLHRLRKQTTSIRYLNLVSHNDNDPILKEEHYFGYATFPNQIWEGFHAPYSTTEPYSREVTGNHLTAGMQTVTDDVDIWDKWERINRARPE